MTVHDASVVVDALIVGGAAGRAAREELRDVTVLEVPAVFPAECVSAVRSLLARGAVSAPRAAAALGRLRALRTREYPFTPFLERAWELRGNLTVYDAWYVALAEQLETDLVTADRRLLGTPGVGCVIRSVGA